ncbi:hypothetical protein DXG03_003306 [Asterophora parasitica]|uniref:Rho termination factor N-terminal domain-containing protein n=1 Tax=Asterophora parasitica TaxID=117018 RepID=A0A9P7G9T5_9AGAR|nr:hypothetical protein DXG03_003306 [Asterophora parasitica]
MHGPTEAALIPEELGKLTVAQLKAICKERKITAYSKLAKPAIIQKIISQSLHCDSGSKFSSNAVSRREGVSSQQPRAIAAASSVAGVTDKDAKKSQSRTATENALVALPTHHKQASTSVSVADSSSKVPIHSPSVIAPSPTASNPVAKRKTMLPPMDVNHPKRQKTAGLSSLLPTREIQPAMDRPNEPASPASPTTNSRPRMRIPNVYFQSLENHPPSGKAIVIPNTVKSSVRLASATTDHARNAIVPLESQTVLMNGKPTAPKRFVPLVLKKANAPHLTLPSTTELIPPTSLQHLDFSPTSTVSLRPVSLPPSLSQRKMVARLALVFSFLPGVVLQKFSQVSRLFRYAGVRLAPLQVSLPGLSADSRYRRSLPVCRATPFPALPWKSPAADGQSVFPEYDKHVALPPTTQRRSSRSSANIFILVLGQSRRT